MVSSESPVSVAILSLLTFISIALAGYLTMYCYTHIKSRQKRKKISLPEGHWLDQERKPLIPGHFHTETIQPVLDDDFDAEDSIVDEVDTEFVERDYTKLGRMIFVMRYHKKREELMVRLVQIEGMPVSQEIYSPNSAYVDVQLKYTGQRGAESNEVQKPPRLDICLQQVYYFIISTQQMMSHSLEFQVNTFDDHFRRYVSGSVEVDLSEEMGDDIFTGSEVVFVKEIAEPFKLLGYKNVNEDEHTNALPLYTEDTEKLIDEVDIPVRADSPASNMSWENESKELISLSMSSLSFRCCSEQDFTLNPLTDFKRSHSIGYLPTNEWTIKDIPLDDEEVGKHLQTLDDSPNKKENINGGSDDLHIGNPPPESFYHIVPTTPLYTKDLIKPESEIALRRFAYKKHPKRKQLARSLTISRRSTTRNLLKKPRSHASLDRSSSWPSLIGPDFDSSADVTPVHTGKVFFGDS